MSSLLLLAGRIIVGGVSFCVILKAVCLLSLPMCVWVCVGSLFSGEVLRVFSSFAKSDLIALLHREFAVVWLLVYFVSFSRCRELVYGM